MTTKAINEALLAGRVVVLRDDPLLCIVPDLWGELVVVSRGQEPFDTRLATRSDKRRAVLFEQVKSEKFATAFEINCKL